MMRRAICRAAGNYNERAVGLGAGLDELPPDASALAIVSVPGQYAVAEAAEIIDRMAGQ